MSFVSAYLANISGDGESPYFLEKNKNFEMFRTYIHFYVIHMWNLFRRV